MTPEEVFAKLERRIDGDPGLVDEVGGVFQFDVGGDGGGSWVVDLKNGSGGVTTGPASEPDCVISVDQEDLAGIFTGQVDPQTAFLMGRIKVTGNFMLATQLRALVD